MYEDIILEIRNRYFARHPDVQRPAHLFQDERVLKENHADAELIFSAQEIVTVELFSAWIEFKDGSTKLLCEDKSNLRDLFSIIAAGTFFAPPLLTEEQVKDLFHAEVVKRRATRQCVEARIPRGETRYGRFRSGCIIRSPEGLEWNIVGAELNKPAPPDDLRVILGNTVFGLGYVDIEFQQTPEPQNYGLVHAWLPDEPGWKVLSGSDSFLPDQVISKTYVGIGIK